MAERLFIYNVHAILHRAIRVGSNRLRRWLSGHRSDLSQTRPDQGCGLRWVRWSSSRYQFSFLGLVGVVERQGVESIELERPSTFAPASCFCRILTPIAPLAAPKASLMLPPLVRARLRASQNKLWSLLFVIIPLNLPSLPLFIATQLRCRLLGRFQTVRRRKKLMGSKKSIFFPHFTINLHHRERGRTGGSFIQTMGHSLFF